MTHATGSSTNVMSRASPCRLVTLTTVGCIGAYLVLVALYAFFPVLPYSWDEQLGNNVLIGSRVTRVYETRDWYTSNSNEIPTAQAVVYKDRHAFALDFKISCSPGRGTTYFHIGDSTPVNLTSHAEKADIIEVAPETVIPVRSLQNLVAEAKIGDFDGINLPWFSQADAILLFYDIHGETVDVPLQLEAHENKMSLWPDSASWIHNGRPHIKVNDPMIQLQSNDGFKSCAGIQVQMPSQESCHNTSPSRTFLFRRFLQRIIVPIGLFISHHFVIVEDLIGLTVTVTFGLVRMVSTLATMYAGVVVVCWVCCKRPRFSPWFRSFVLTRHLSAKLRGLASDGPQNTSDDGEGEADSTGKRKLQPLRSVMDFFRSASPLDDLLVTFAATRHWVEPISWGRDSSAPDNAEVTSMPNDIKVGVSSRASKSGNNLDTDVEKGYGERFYDNASKDLNMPE